MDIASPKPAEPAAGNEIDRPQPSAQSNRIWGSDAIAEIIRALDIPYVALNPGSTYRGLHDSLVNKLGNERPQMLLCLHEEAAVAIAHGWAKVTGKADAGDRPRQCRADAWHDGGVQRLVRPHADDPARRHRRRSTRRSGGRGSTGSTPPRDNGALMRNYTKWDDQPASIGAALGIGAARAM